MFVFFFSSVLIFFSILLSSFMRYSFERVSVCESWA